MHTMPLQLYRHRACIAIVLCVAATVAWGMNDQPSLRPIILDYGQALSYSMRFYEAQRSGVLPASNRVPWRGDADALDKAPDNSDLGGGYYDGGGVVDSTIRGGGCTVLHAALITT